MLLLWRYVSLALEIVEYKLKLSKKNSIRIVRYLLITFDGGPHEDANMGCR